MWLRLMNWWSGIRKGLPELRSSLAEGDAYLAQATDAADLERRLEQVERHTREAALTRLKAIAWARA